METGTDKGSADAILEHLGYTPELSRNRSVLQVAFMCFILSSVPYGLATTFFYPLAAGGPSTIVWGWIIVSLVILCVAISLAEITSVYPTAGGVYYQTFALSPPWCRRAAAWICGWAYVLGNITITLAVNFGTTLFFVACLNVFESEPGVGIVDDMQTYQIYLIFLAITLLTHAISSLGNKWLPSLEVCFFSFLFFFYLFSNVFPPLRPVCLGSQCDFSCVSSPHIDFGHLLDPHRPDCPDHLRPCGRQTWSTLW